MMGASDRRGFLRGLTALPLINGPATALDVGSREESDTDPIFAMLAMEDELHRAAGEALIAEEGGDVPEAHARDAMDRWNDYLTKVASTVPHSVAGLAGVLERINERHVVFSPGDGLPSVQFEAAIRSGKGCMVVGRPVLVEGPDPVLARIAAEGPSFDLTSTVPDDAYDDAVDAWSRAYHAVFDLKPVTVAGFAAMVRLFGEREGPDFDPGD